MLLTEITPDEMAEWGAVVGNLFRHKELPLWVTVTKEEYGDLLVAGLLKVVPKMRRKEKKYASRKDSCRSKTTRRTHLLV